jgi:hypothetical protein
VPLPSGAVRRAQRRPRGRVAAHRRLEMLLSQDLCRRIRRTGSVFWPRDRRRSPPRRSCRSPTSPCTRRSWKRAGHILRRLVDGAQRARRSGKRAASGKNGSRKTRLHRGTASPPRRLFSSAKPGGEQETALRRSGACGRY